MEGERALFLGELLPACEEDVTYAWLQLPTVARGADDA